MRDFAFEALAEVTSTDWEVGRGELNSALRSIKEQEPEIFDNYLLSVEIHDRAKLYVELMGEGIPLTPSALAKHWKRAKEQQPKAPVPTYQSLGTEYTPFFCSTCEGHRMVRVRPAPDEDQSLDQYAPCPDCNQSANAGFWRWDGTRFDPPRADEVKARMLHD